MGIFIDVIIEKSKCRFNEGCEECIKVCPVDIFFKSADGLSVRDEDECTLCNQCIDVCPENAIQIVRKYL